MIHLLHTKNKNVKIYRIKIEVADSLRKEMLIAQLSAAGANGFEEEKNLLKAFIMDEDYNESESKEIIEKNGLKYSISVIEERNWNAEWEANFKPVQVGNFCIIRAAFHEANNSIKHDIIITPKMSFGTGHHATTHMMLQAMEGLDFNNKASF